MPPSQSDLRPLPPLYSQPLPVPRPYTACFWECCSPPQRAEIRYRHRKTPGSPLSMRSPAHEVFPNPGKILLPVHLKRPGNVSRPLPLQLSILSGSEGISLSGGFAPQYTDVLRKNSPDGFQAAHPENDMLHPWNFSLSFSCPLP